MAKGQHNDDESHSQRPDADDKDRSKPARTDSRGDPEPAQPSAGEQSGSVGRRTDRVDTGKDTGQGRYGQSGLGGQGSSETEGEADYRKSAPDGGQQPSPEGTRVGNRIVHPTKDAWDDPDQG